MALNPFFLQGSPNEQRLVQELINEQLKIFGVEVIYIPRKFVRKETILKEISSSKFDDNFAIEAYINNYDGYTGQGDILTKFGVSLKDELSLVISRERYEDFIIPLLGEVDEELELISRPREGDLVYFPLGQRLFEVKFVEHESSFYQLGKLYVYELKCELFEYEDEVLNTSIDEIDTQLQDEGYVISLNMLRTGELAAALPFIGTGYVKNIYLNNDGYGYISTPTVSIETAPSGGTNATAVAITTSIGRVRSIKEILIVNPGSGYTVAPAITINGGGGVGAAATCSIETNSSGVVNIQIINKGSGYVNPPFIEFTNPQIGTDLAVGVGSLSADGKLESILITNPGSGYVVEPNIFIEPPPISTDTENYKFNEIVTGSNSGTTARVKSWNAGTNVLKVSIIKDVSTRGFYPGESIIGSETFAQYTLSSYDSFNTSDKYSQNKTIEQESDQIVDFSESNPFGTF
jgi:hypothetical protein